VSTQWNVTSIKTYVRDLILFGVGIVIILKQAGILFPPPVGGVSLELLFLGALFCNGPLVLQYLSLRRGIPTPLPPAPPSVPDLPLGPPSASSSGGDG
jgi:hypothetical protein